MLIIGDYDKVEIDNKFKYGFFVNNKYEYGEGTSFCNDLYVSIVNFSKNLGNNGLVVMPYDSSVESIGQEISEKLCDEDVKSRQTPGILMIETDFNKFDHNENNWIYINFASEQEIHEGSNYVINVAESLFDDLCKIIMDDDKDIFTEANDILIKNKIRESVEECEEEISNCAINIGAIKFLDFLDELIQK